MSPMPVCTLLLAQYTRPFIQPLPVWNYWWALSLPLIFGICVVYKSVKCSQIGEVPRAAVIMMGWILAALVASGIALLIFVKLTQ